MRFTPKAIKIGQILMSHMKAIKIGQKYFLWTFDNLHM